MQRAPRITGGIQRGGHDNEIFIQSVRPVSRRSEIIYVGSVRNFCGFHNFFPEMDGFRIFLNTPGNRKFHYLLSLH